MTETGNGLAHLHRRPVASAGTATIRLTITINGDEYYGVLLDSFEELEDDGGVRGILFVEHADGLGG